MALVPAAASAEYILNDFETSSAPWSTGTIKTAYATSGTNSLRITLPASDMWYCTSTSIDVTQYTAEQREAAFTNATKLIIDFTVGTYTASWMNDHHVGFILQGTGEANNWVSLGSQAWDGLADTTTAEIAITPAQAAILASDPAAKLFLYADYGNGSDMGIQLYVDTFRTDAGSEDPVWYAPYTEVSENVVDSEWFGVFRMYDSDYIYHYDLRWLYCTTTDNWLIAYAFNGLGWLATCNGFYPYIYLYEVPSVDGQSMESGWVYTSEDKGDGYTWIYFFDGSRAQSGTDPQYPGWWRF
jgi:hypothetical protein